VPLVLVATPIGNLGDLSSRAAAMLATADCICCEDTRRTGRLLVLAGIERRQGVPLVRIDDHTEAARVEQVLDRVRRGERVVVVTDAGTPGIADPGERLVRAAAAADLPVEVVPGPSAAVAALVASGLPTGRFAFEGFLPRKGSGRTERLADLAGERRTMVLYEAPHRLARTLADLADALGGDRRTALVRELTKLHEEVRRTTLDAAAAWAASAEPIGEFVVVVDGAPEPPAADDTAVASAVRAAMAAGSSARDAAAAVAVRLGVQKRRAYEMAVALRHSEQPDGVHGPRGSSGA
jgi:16S rRNA (cytidine1402-2'-O)-methyltransferase